MANGNPFYTHQPTPYVPQYVPQPIEEFAQAAGAIQGRYDTNIASKNQMDIMAANLELSPGDEWLREDMIAGIDTDLEEIIKSGRWQDASYLVPEVFKNRIGANKGIIWSTKQAGEIAKFKDMYVQSGGDSGAYNFNPGEGFASVVKNPQTGELEYVPYNGDVEKRLNFDGRKETLFNQMPQLTSKTGMIDADNPSLIKYVTTQGISDYRMRQYLSEAFTRYKETPEYDQEKKALLSPHYGNQDGQMTEEMADEIIIDSLYAVGKEVVGVSSDTQYVTNPAYKGKKIGVDKSTEAFESIDTPAVANNANISPYRIKDKDFDEKGNLTSLQGISGKTKGMIAGSGLGPFLAPLIAPLMIFPLAVGGALAGRKIGKNSETKEGAELVEAQKWISGIRDSNPYMADMNDKDVYNSYINANQKLEDVTGKLWVLGDDYFPSSDGMFLSDEGGLGDFTGRKMWVDGQAVTDKKGLLGFIRKSASADVIKELKTVGVTGFTQTGSAAGNMVGTVNMDGRAHNIEIENTDQVQYYTHTSWELSQRIKNSQEGVVPFHVPNADGIAAIAVRSEIVADPQLGGSKYSYEIIPLDANGQPIQELIGLSLEDIMRVEQAYLRDEGYVKPKS